MNQDVRKLSNEMLIAILDKRVELESLNEAEMIDFIREVMHRRLWLQYGATNMFDFMTRAHYHYAPVVAQRKIDAARLLQLFPEVKDFVISGEVNLTQLGMLASGFRQKPVPSKLQREILKAIKGQTIKNTQVVLNEMLEIEVKTRPKVRVQRDGSVRVEMTFTKEQWEVIERAKEVVSHSVPSSELTEVLSYCASFTVSKKDFAAYSKASSASSKAHTAPSKYSSASSKASSVSSTDFSTLSTASSVSSKELSASPKNSSVSNGSHATKDFNASFDTALLPSMEVKARHGQGHAGQEISRATRRFVHQRDQSCRHIHPDGSRCESRYQLQVDHIISRWRGGSNDVENLQLLCGIHNRYKYEREVS